MRRTKSEAEQTHNSILDAALTLFDEQGYTQTTLSSVARQAGVTRGAIYWHFENKDEILIALAQAIASTITCSDTSLAPASTIVTPLSIPRPPPGPAPSAPCWPPGRAAWPFGARAPSSW